MHDDQIREEAKALLKSEDGVKGLMSGNTVYTHPTFSQGIIPFSARQYVFLRQYAEHLDLEREDIQSVDLNAMKIACEKSGMSLQQAERFFQREKVQAWIDDLFEKMEVKMKWSVPEKLMQEYDGIYEGTVEKSEMQFKALDRIAERIWPQVSRNAPQAPPKIEINIDPSSVQEAFRRQSAIEAQIIEEQKAS